MNTNERGMNLAEIPRLRVDPNAPHVDWESVAGRAFKEKQEAEHEVKRLRGAMPPDALREYDRRHHGAA